MRSLRGRDRGCVASPFAHARTRHQWVVLVVTVVAPLRQVSEGAAEEQTRAHVRGDVGDADGAEALGGDDPAQAEQSLETEERACRGVRSRQLVRRQLYWAVAQRRDGTRALCFLRDELLDPGDLPRKEREEQAAKDGVDRRRWADARRSASSAHGCAW